MYRYIYLSYDLELENLQFDTPIERVIARSKRLDDSYTATEVVF